MKPGIIYKKSCIQEEGLNEFDNPFQSWANNIYMEGRNYIKEGSGINPLYIPSLAPIHIKIMKLLPLWSGIMTPVFGYGDEISSSAAIESSFKKLKTVTFKHKSIPTDLEIFLENHIQSLKGASILLASRKNISPLSHSIFLESKQLVNNNQRSLLSPLISDNIIVNKGNHSLILSENSNIKQNEKKTKQYTTIV